MKALALVDSPDHVCCRYRIRAFEPALERHGWTLRIEGLASSPAARIRQFVAARRFDAVVLQRKLLSGWDLGLLRQSSRRLVYDFDDAVFWRDSYHEKGHRDRRRSVRFARTVRQADVVLAGNDFLAARALLAGGSSEAVRVLPTCVEPGHARGNDPVEPCPGSMRLGWIGSSSTLRGLEGRRSLWDRLGREMPGLSLRVICDRFPSLGALTVEPYPWSEATEAEALAGCDVGISWMPDDLWSLGKCGLKVLQYQAAGLPVLANPVGVHSEMIVPGRSGFLVEQDDQWIAAIRLLAHDADLRRRMGRSGRSAVEAGYAVSVWASTFVSALSEIATPLAPSGSGLNRSTQRKPATPTLTGGPRS